MSGVFGVGLLVPVTRVRKGLSVYSTDLRPVDDRTSSRGMASVTTLLSFRHRSSGNPGPGPDSTTLGPSREADPPLPRVEGRADGSLFSTQWTVFWESLG